MNTEEYKVLDQQQAMEEDSELDLMGLFYHLLEKMKYIIAVALLGAIVMAVYSFVLATPVFEATCKLYVLNPQDSAVNLSDLQIGSYLTSDYQQVFNAWEVHEMVLQKLDKDYSYEHLNKMLTVENPSNTRMLNITVASSDPAEAALMANTYAEVARSYISDTMHTEEPSIMSSALEPIKAVKPDKKLNILLGFLVGAVLMALVATLQFLLDDRIRSADDVRRCANIPTLAVIPYSEEDEYFEKKSGYAGRKQRA